VAVINSSDSEISSDPKVVWYFVSQPTIGRAKNCLT
jgi:hypothetical protein